MCRRILFVACALVATRAFASSPTPVPSFASLTTGNGFGFSVFDIAQKKVTTFLERPYRYLTPGTDPHGEGVYRRDLAFDVYFGARSDTAGGWMMDQPQTSVGYVDQSGVIRSTGTIGPLQVESTYFAPFGFEHNALVMIAKATNTSGATANAQLFALPNFRLGAGGDDPSFNGETITTTGTHTVETGALGDSGGAMVYVPVGALAKADCGGGWSEVKAGGELPADVRGCSGDDRTIIFQSELRALAPGETMTFGLVIGFSPAASGANALASAIDTYLASRTGDKLVADTLAEWEAWRKPPPNGLSDDEKRVFRQAEATIRMAQVREPWQETPKQKGHGMILASLPPGIWHIGWVRDATYAIVALARSGHLAEARDALRFFLSAEGGTYASYAGGPYRISVTRYFGDGQEESDWNADGPNIEFDGWGLYLWALRQYIDAAGDGAMLGEALDTGEGTFDVVRNGVAGPLLHDLEPGGLVTPDTSIWESHWEKRKHYAFTSLAAARGLCDLASIESRYGDPQHAANDRDAAAQLRAAIRAGMLDQSLLLGGSKEGVAGGTYHDGAVYEAFNWNLFTDDDPLYPATLSGLDSSLRLPSLGYERNDDNASTYDSNEWVFIDLRAAGAYRLRGNGARADELVAWVTSQARANYDLIPELYNSFTDAGPLWSYAGAIPMVGFGAAQYVLAMHTRAGNLDTQDCGAGTSVSGDGGTNVMGPSNNDAGCSCALGRLHVSCGAIALVGLGTVLLFALFRRRRHA